MSSITLCVLAAIATLLAAFWLFLHLRYRRDFDEVIAGVTGKEYLLPELYYIGFGCISLFHINLQTARSKKQQERLSEIYGQYAEFYHYVMTGAKLTYIVTFIPLGLFLGICTRESLLCILAVLLSIILAAYLDETINNIVDNRRDELLEDFPQMLSKLTLLVNAGVILRDAWVKVALSGDRIIYQEMQQTSGEMNNGVSDIDAITHFAQRCSIREVKKFCSALIQNLQKGSAGLSSTLKELSAESWMERKHSVRRKGELAGQKLLIPIMIMFVGILMIVILPIFMNML